MSWIDSCFGFKVMVEGFRDKAFGSRCLIFRVSVEEFWA